MMHTIYPIACRTCGVCAFCDPLGCEHGDTLTSPGKPLSAGVEVRCGVMDYSPESGQAWASITEAQWTAFARGMDTPDGC